MKFSIFLGAILLTTGFLYGQVIQGDIVITPATGNSWLAFATPTAVSATAGTLSRTIENGLIIAVLPTVGYAVTDNLVAGIGINVVRGLSSRSPTIDGISPYLRYYAVNTEFWHLYGGGRATVVLSAADANRLGRVLLQPTLGVGVVMGEGLYLSPELSFSANRKTNPVHLELKFDILLATDEKRRHTRLNRYKHGSWMMGTRTGGLRIARGDNGRNMFQLLPEVHFFVVDQLALGLELGTEISWAADVPAKSSVHGGLNVRYVPVHDGTIDLFGQAGFHFQSSGGRLAKKLKPEGGGLANYNAGVGAMLFPRDYFALEAGLGAAHYPFTGFTELAISGGVRIFPGR